MTGILRGIMVFFSAAVAVFIPDAAYRYACWKCEKKDRPYPLQPDRRISMAVCVIGCSLFTGFCSCSVPGWKMCFACLFVWIAFFGACVDSLIRIIGNEMLLALFFAGIIYRALCGGFAAYAGSLEAMGAMLVLFIVSAFIMKFLSGTRGVGMGDIKLAMVASFIAGMENISLFVIGMCAAMLLYIGFKLFNHTLTMRSTFPMCFPLMAGMLAAFAAV